MNIWVKARCALGIHDWRYSKGNLFNSALIDTFGTFQEPMRRCHHCHKHEWLLSHCLGLNPIDFSYTWIHMDSVYMHARGKWSYPILEEMTREVFSGYMWHIEYYFAVKNLEKDYVTGRDINKVRKIRRKLLDRNYDPDDFNQLDIKEPEWNTQLK